MLKVSCKCVVYYVIIVVKVWLQNRLMAAIHFDVDCNFTFYISLITRERSLSQLSGSH